MGRSCLRWLKAAAALVLLLVLLGSASACPDGMPMHAAMHGRGERPAQTPVAVEGTSATVEISNYDFVPRDLTVAPGTVVTWVNRDAVPHDATDVGRSWTTDILGQGESKDLTFDSPGTYSYLCTIHPNMTATLSVGQTPSPP